MYFHDSDPRYQDREVRARVASLYLPLVGICIDNLARLYSWSHVGEVRIVGSSDPNEHLNMILTAISDNVPNVSYVRTKQQSTMIHYDPQS